MSLDTQPYTTPGCYEHRILDSRLLTFAIWQTMISSNMVRSIPRGRKPGSRPYRRNVYQEPKHTPHHAGTRHGTLETLLTEAERLESEQMAMVKRLPSDEELQRLDKLQFVVTQLKTQIALSQKRSTLPVV